MWLLLIALAFTALGAWCATVGQPQIIWAFRIGAPLATLAVAWGIYKVQSLPETLPDHLRAIAGKYFERDGLCFAMRLETTDGRCALCVYFQNRNGGHASSRVMVLPPRRTLRYKRHPLPAPTILIECPGGAFGVVRVPFPVSAKYWGRRMSFDVAADTRYPAGRGELLRHRQGLRVNSTRDLSGAGQLLAALLLLPLGVVFVRTPARVTLDLPRDVAETDPTDATAETEILWLPDLPTGGFPVMPPTRVAA